MRFKTKSLEIDAWRWDCGEPMPEWFESRINDTILFLDNDPSAGYVVTMEGRIGYSPDHWIVLDTNGEPYPYPDIDFKKKYERV